MNSQQVEEVVDFFLLANKRMLECGVITKGDARRTTTRIKSWAFDRLDEIEKTLQR